MDRTFKATDRFGAEIEFELREPDKEAIRISDMQYRIAYSVALKEGILPREKMREIFKESGIWDDDDEKSITNVIKDLSITTLKLEEASKRGDRDECIKIAGDMASLRIRMFQLFLVQHSCFLNSCEGYAELVRLESLMALSVFIKHTNQRYWKAYKDYVIERDQNDKSNVVFNASTLNNKLLELKKDELVNEYPEQRWLQKVHAEILEAATNHARQVISDKVEEIKKNDSVATENS